MGEPATARTGRLRSAARAALAAAWLALVAACASEPDLSWKHVVLSGVDREQLFTHCHEIVASHYGGTTIRVDRKAGKIETGEVEEVIGGKVLRERCLIDLQPVDGGLELAVFVPMTRREFDPNADVPVRWLVHGSDVVVEAILLDEICGKALAAAPDARVVSTNLPRADAER